MVSFSKQSKNFQEIPANSNDEITIKFLNKNSKGIQGTINIAYENEDFLAINKPANLSVHNDINLNQDRTLVDLLTKQN